MPPRREPVCSLSLHVLRVPPPPRITLAACRRLPRLWRRQRRHPPSSPHSTLRTWLSCPRLRKRGEGRDTYIRAWWFKQERERGQEQRTGQVRWTAGSPDIPFALTFSSLRSLLRLRLPLLRSLSLLRLRRLSLRMGKSREER